MSILEELSRREREVMGILFASGEATVAEIGGGMREAPTRPALRSILTILVEKGHVEVSGKRGREMVYRAKGQAQAEGRSAWRRLLGTFFGGSLCDGLAAHLADPAVTVTTDELKALEKLIRDARRRTNDHE